jgi:hypothetical protein
MDLEKTRQHGANLDFSTGREASGRKGRENKARAGSSAQAYSYSTPSTRIKCNAVIAGHCVRAAATC